MPVWATLISLMERGEGGYQPVVGVVSAPALGRRWWAAKGGGAYTGRSLTLGEPAARLEGRAGSGTPRSRTPRCSGWEEQGRLDGFLDLTRACWRTRGYGDFWPYMMVAEGSVDICAEPELSLWDMAANAIIVQEAGGTLHRPRRHARARTAATRRRPTACSTTSCWATSTSATDAPRAAD